jgi:hypothetical protein
VNYKRVLISLSLATLAVAPVPALAQARAYAYFGAGLGVSDAKKFCDERPNCDKGSTAWRLFGGVQFTPNLGVEIGYVDLGETRGVDASGTLTKRETSATDLVAVLSYPMNRLSVSAKAGGYYGKPKATFETATGTTYGRESKGGVTFGLGAQYDFTPAFGMRADWQRYAQVGGGTTGSEVDIDAFMVGIVWKMR